MTKEQQKVKEWMQKFGQETPEKPCIPSRDICKLRAKLNLEETLEGCLALGMLGLHLKEQAQFIDFRKLKEIVKSPETAWSYCEPNLTEIADFCADSSVVGYCGTAVACGLDMEPIFDEVVRSNDSKRWTLKEKLRAPLDYSITNVTSMNPNEMLDTDRCYLVKDKSGKVIKSPSYSPANLEPIIETQRK